MAGSEEEGDARITGLLAIILISGSELKVLCEDILRERLRFSICVDCFGGDSKDRNGEDLTGFVVFLGCWN